MRTAGPIVAALALGGAALGLAGCTGLEPAALSAGASVAQTGVTIFDRGKARTIERTDYDDMVAAVRRVMVRLSLTQTLEDPAADGRRVRMSFHDERGQSIVMVIERRTETVTLLQADVGALGEIGWATLVIKQVLADLTNAGSLPRPPEPPKDQPPEPAIPTPPPPPPTTPAQSIPQGSAPAHVPATTPQ